METEVRSQGAAREIGGPIMEGVGPPSSLFRPSAEGRAMCSLESERLLLRPPGRRDIPAIVPLANASCQKPLGMSKWSIEAGANMKAIPKAISTWPECQIRC